MDSNDSGQTAGEEIRIGKNRLFFWSVIIAVLNPVPGLIMGLVLLSVPGARREGRIVTLFSIVWGIIAFLLAYKLQIGQLTPVKLP